jgi:S1-C subfamily serine protease
MTKGVLCVLTLLALGQSVFGQVPRPKRHHRDLDQRYKDISCALVLVQSGNKLGTGFYVNPEGDVVTASHVLGDRIFSTEGDQLRITIPLPLTITLKTSTEEFTVPGATSVENNADEWSADLAVLHTGRRTSCWLQTANDELVRPGQNVIAMGFPGLAFGSLSLYSGIISARIKSGLITGFTTQGQPLTATNDFLRIQMPISTGLSGAPVIDDENRAIAVVTSAGAWSQGLEILVQHTNQLGPEVPQPNTLNLAALLAELASLFHDYVSPGYGDSVPLSYLAKKAPTGSPQPAPPAR